MEIKKIIEKKKANIQREINNVFIWSTIAFDALIETSKDKAFINKGTFEVPSKSGMREIKRDKTKARELLNDAIEYGLYYSMTTYIVAQFENFISDVISELLKHEPRKLLERVNGINHQKTIALNTIILNSSREEIIDEIIEAELISIMYASPQKQNEYFRDVLKINVESLIWDKWFEYKATRDIIIHNSGYVNDTYIGKAGVLARGVIGNKIEVDDVYFEDMIKTLKSFAGKISTAVKQEY